MLTELCQYLRNWFDRNQPKFFGSFVIQDGTILFDGKDMTGMIKEGQYIRIVGSALNDGVYAFPSNGLIDETFDGAIWAMAVPPAVINLASEITAWREKYESVDSAAMSPFTSESFGGYSYSKSGASSTNAGGGQAPSWQGAFASRLSSWRKIR